jgi:4-amino-4-deoxy-L-arabinose transferase-like glycosyltransferase
VDAPPSARARTLVLAGAAVLLLARLGATGLWAPDEPRYGQVAEELRSLRHGAAGLVLLHLDGEPYTQKPPLWFWLAAACGAPLGRVTEAAARLPAALAGIALVATTLGFGARLLGGPSGVLGASLLLTTFAFAESARRAALDAPLALFETLALCAFWRLDRGIGAPRRNQLALHAALGLAVLTKGPVGFLVPMLVAAAHLLLERRPRDLARALPASGLLLSLGPALAWVAAAATLAPAGFLDRAVGENLFGRFFEGTSHARPFYYYLYQFPLEFLPWVLAVPAALPAWRRAAASGDGEERRAVRFLLAWVGATLVFFSLSSGKRGVYVLPALPAAALLVAHGLWRETLALRRLPPRFVAASAGVGAALAGAGAWVALADPLRDAAASRATGAAAIAIAAAGLAASSTLARRRASLGARVAVPVAAVWATLLVLFTWTWPARDAEKSPRTVAEAAGALVPPDGAIGLVGDRALLGGLAYYAGRRVAWLEDADAIARYVAEGGGAIVVQASKRERVDAVVRAEVRFRAREGRRALLVLAPRRDESG